MVVHVMEQYIGSLWVLKGEDVNIVGEEELWQH